VEEAARKAEDAEKLTLHMRTMADLLVESEFWARRAGRSLVTAQDVQAALAAQRRRSGRAWEGSLEQIRRQTILIDTEGERVGQVNALSVVQVGQLWFGLPNRVSARVWAGKADLVDIDRQVELGGPLHSKGVLILQAYLAARYGCDRPLALCASLVFEQSYSLIEGDSASLAELCALLSALADSPVQQSLAVTGSVDQHGHVQAIGGVNEKVEGFFELCRQRGLNRRQGVLIPASNRQSLMLDPEVVGAVRAGGFCVYAVECVDQALELLTGLSREELARRIHARLARMAEAASANWTNRLS
jgi:predicted ATP-dependent protease